MKYFISVKIVLFILLFSSQIKAQEFITSTFGKDVYKNIESGTTYLVLTGNKTYDEQVTKSVTEYWKVTPFKIILAKDIDKYLGDSKNYFLAPMHFRIERPETLAIRAPQPTDADMDIVFFNGKFKKLDDYAEGYMLSLSSSLMWVDNKVSVEWLDYAVKKVNKNIDGRIKVANNGTVETQKFNTGSLKTKTLLVSKNLSNHFCDESVLAKYKYKYKIMDSEELAKKLKDNDPNFCYLDLSGCDSRYAYIIDLETKELIYSLVTNSFFKIKEKEIEKLNNCIEENCE